MARPHGVWLAALLLLPLGASCATAVHTPPAPAPRPTLTQASLPPLSSGGGGRIAFSSNRDGNYELYVMNADGSDVRRLTHNPYEDRGPAWSPDGTQLAFESNRVGHMDVYVINADGSGERRLTSKGGEEPAWAPDGLHITFTRGAPASDLYVMNADGSDVQRLTDLGDSLAVFGANWSPDGSQLLCVVDRNPNAPAAAETTVYVLDVEALPQAKAATMADLLPLPRPGKSLNDKAVWSPDGLRILFSAEVYTRREIYVVNADGAGLQRLTEPGSLNGYVAGWSPDGDRICFQSSPEGQWDIYLMNADGSAPQRLTSDSGNDTEPTWSR